MPATVYTLQSLSTEIGVSPRTLRSWIRQKLLPKPLGRGRAARYHERHLLLARAVRHLRATDDRLSLAAIRARIGNLPDDQLRAFVPAAPRSTTEDGVPASPPAPTYPAMMWEVVQLMDGMVLMLNPSKGPVLRRVADDIYRHYALPSQGRAQ